MFNKLVSIGCFSRLPLVLFKPVQTFLNDTQKATYNLSVIFGSFQSIDSKKTFHIKSELLARFQCLFFGICEDQTLDKLLDRTTHQHGSDAPNYTVDAQRADGFCAVHTPAWTVHLLAGLSVSQTAAELLRFSLTSNLLLFCLFGFFFLSITWLSLEKSKPYWHFLRTVGR